MWSPYVGRYLILGKLNTNLRGFESVGYEGFMPSFPKWVGKKSKPFIYQRNKQFVAKPFIG